MRILSRILFKILAVWAILLILIANQTYAIVKQSLEFYVNDTANILSEDTKEYIMNMNQNLEKQTGAQIVVVTVKSLEGLSIEDYALKLARSYRNWR